MTRKDELLEIEADEPEMLHSVLSKLPRPLDLESLISDTVSLFQRYPPERLPGRTWAQISTHSVLKTTRDFGKLSKQTLQDGERDFEREAAELRRQEVVQQTLKQYKALARQYRRPATFTGIAAIVALIAILTREQAPASAVSGLNTAFLGLQRRVIELWQLFGK